ncbi:MAG TPA: flagellar basal body rod protein FlgB [Deltaproteobacteria bacterium]|nr:flagellar basal body rod protein FlgB [Deltaproteobacteria bacterium]
MFVKVRGSGESETLFGTIFARFSEERRRAMDINKIFGSTFDLLRVRLGLDVKEHELISSNIANIDTPNYVAKKLSFDETLERFMSDFTPSLRTTNPKHFSFGAGGPEADNFVVDETGEVDIDKELSRLAENSIHYQALVNILSKKFTMLKLAISEGGK